MPTITSIEVQKRDKKRVNLFLDGEFAIGLDAAAAMGSRLKTGEEISLTQLEEIALKSELNTAFDKAAKKLSSRPHSQKEIFLYLKEKGYSPSVVGAAISRLKEYGYVDDAAFARAFVQGYAHRLGKTAIKQRLKAAGVNDEIVAEALDYDDGDGAKTAAEKYLKTHDFDAQKLYNYLRNKGFSHDISRELSKACTAEEE